MNLESLKQKITSFTKNDNTLGLVVDNLFSILEEINHDNVVAFINELDESRHSLIDICDMDAFEDFEFVDPTYRFQGSELSADALQEKIDELEDKRDVLTDQIDDQERCVEEIEEDGMLNDATRASELVAAQLKLDRLESELRDVESDLEDAENSQKDGPSYPDCWMNKVHIYEDGINSDVAAQCNLQIIKFLKPPHEGEEALMIAGCGMDVAHEIMFYEALTYGALRPSMIDRLTGINYNYYKSNLGDERWAKFIERLNIPQAAATEKSRATEERLRRLEESFDQLSEMNKDPKNRELVMVSALAIAATTK
jgi:chromosome segregation ATPase